MMDSISWIIRSLTIADLPFALRLSRQADWEDVIGDWHRVLAWQPDGCFVAEIGGHLIGTITSIRYGRDLAWVGYMLVDVAHRRKGVASSLMCAVVDQLAKYGVSRVMVDASEMGQPLYERFDFRPLQRVNTWVGQAGVSRGDCPRLAPHHLTAVSAFDRRQFGADRAKIITVLATEFPDLARVDLDAHGKVLGYLIGYRRSDLVQVGPWVHTDVEGASRLLGSTMKACSGHPLIVRTPEVNSGATKILEKAGFLLRDTAMRMIMGKADQCSRQETIYAIAGLAVG